MESQGCWYCCNFLHICHICVYPSQLQQRLSISYLPSRTQPSCTFLLSTLHNTQTTQTSRKDLEISDIIFHQQKHKQNTHKLKLSSLSRLYPPPFTYLPSNSPPFFRAHTPKKRENTPNVGIYSNIIDYQSIRISIFPSPLLPPQKKIHNKKPPFGKIHHHPPQTRHHQTPSGPLPWLQHPNSCSAG